MDLTLIQNIEITENVSVNLFSSGTLSQNNLNLQTGGNYKLLITTSGMTGSLDVKENSTLISTISGNGTNATFFVSIGGSSISFAPSSDFSGVIDNISLRHILQPLIASNSSVKEFLVGETDEGREITFRADTQILQLVSEFEIFANPISIVTKLQRGTMVKCYIALGDDDFYELKGAITKGTSILKIHSKNLDERTTPPVAREIRISWRDSSKQLCRLTQGGVIFLPTEMNQAE